MGNVLGAQVKQKRLKKRVLAMLVTGHHPTDISKVLGVAYTTVLSWRNKYLTPEQLLRLREADQTLIDDELVGLVQDQVRAQRAILQQFTDPQWLAEYMKNWSPPEIMQAMETLNGQMGRMLGAMQEAAERLKDGDPKALPPAPDDAIAAEPVDLGDVGDV